MNNMKNTLEVHIEFEPDGGYESIWVTPMEPDIYRLEGNPVLSENASFGDVIEVSTDKEGKKHFKRITSQAEFRTYRWVLSSHITTSMEFKNFCDKVKQQGGMWEQVLGGVVIVNIPLSSDFDPELEIMKLM